MDNADVIKNRNRVEHTVRDGPDMYQLPVYDAHITIRRRCTI